MIHIANRSLLVFKDDNEAEDYIRRGAIKALFTLAPFDNLEQIAQNYFAKSADAITSEMIDGLEAAKTQDLFEALQGVAENPGVEKYYIEEVTFFEDPNGNKYPIEIQGSESEKPAKASKASKGSKK